MDWNDVRYFLALARLGSVRAAGVSLGVSHSTVARRVEALEAQLAARLFDRHRDGYQLTAAGQQMVPGAERVEQEMTTLERGLAGRDERLAGSIRRNVLRRVRVGNGHQGADRLLRRLPRYRAVEKVSDSKTTTFMLARKPE